MKLDRVSLLCEVPAARTLREVEAFLDAAGFTLGTEASADGHDEVTVGQWIAEGAPGARDPFADPADHLVAGLTGILHGGRAMEIRPCPRRAAGPDFAALFFGQWKRFGELTSVWLRIVPRGAVAVRRPMPLAFERNAELNAGEQKILATLQQELRK
jgi:alkyldihydroxyacetonephosphate synthase